MSRKPGTQGQWWRRLLTALGLASQPKPAPQVQRPAARSAQPVPTAQPSSQPRARVPRTEVAALHLGIDFGTRYTKVCFRDLGRDRSEVVTFATKAPRLEGALLRSHLELRGGRMLTALTDAEWAARGRPPGAVDVAFIKMRLAQLDLLPGAGRWPLSSIEGWSSDEDLEVLAAFFLGRVIDRACRWVAVAREDLLVGRVPQWSFSVGVSARHANSPVLERFKHALGIGAAWARRGIAESPTFAEARAAVAELRRVSWTTETSVQAEIAAAVRSFITSPRALEGVYLYFDVGAGTLDGASFRFYRPPEAASQLSFYSSEVEQLGMAAVAGMIAVSDGRDPGEVERILGAQHARDRLDGALDGPERDIHTLVAKVILSGRRIDRQAWSAGLEDLAQAFHRRRRTTSALMPLFIGGGGSASPFYRSVILSTYQDRNLENTGVRRYSLENLPLPDDLDMSGLREEHFQRFAVAYGLSIPPGEGPDVEPRPPEPDLPRGRPGSPPGVTDYGDTKDLV